MTHRLAPMSLVLLATTLALAPQPTRADGAAPLPTLQGEAALAHLRREGLDGSLAEALSAARYGARPSPERPDDFTFNNPAQRLRARFDGRGLALESGAAPDRLRLTMRLRSLGYGERQLPVGPGEISAAGQRVESVHSLDGGPAAVVREWFVNRPQGLEHGFTLAEPPGERWKGQPLRLVLGLGGTLRAREVKSGQALELVDATGRSVLSYDHLRVSDAGGRKLPSRMRVAGGELSYEIDDAGARFPVTIDPTFTQQAYLKASNTGAEDLFGLSVAISGDTLVVGALGEDSNATGVDGDQSNNSEVRSGAAYVFVRSAGAWSQQAYLKASNTGEADEFGRSVAISGDTLVIGASGEDSSATGVDGDQSNNNSGVESGAAYVFVRSAGVWSQQAYLKASNTGADDQFGFNVAISGDTLVVGAPGEDSNATGVNGDPSNNSAVNSGAAYVFVRSAGAWSQQAYLKASNTGADDFFGTSVAISGDTLAVGAFHEDSNATGVNGDPSNNSAADSGAAYVFVRSAGAWSQQAYLKASNTGADDQFGGSVAISGDTLVVGASGEDSNATGVAGDPSNNSDIESGAAYVFVRSVGAWSQQAYLKASNTGENDRFGWSVAISGDSLVVGAPGEASNATGVDGDPSNDSAADSGAAYVFVRSAGAWSQQAYLKASNTDGNDEFGSRVAISGGSLVVGAPDEASNATGVDGDQANDLAQRSGAAYMFADLTGYYTLPPCRLVDTRLADGPLGGPALAANVARDFVLAGSCGVPADAVAVVLTVTAVGSTAPGGLQIYTADSTPLTDGGNVHYGAEVTRAGNGILALGAGGAVSALAEQPAGTVHLVLDVVGYFLH